MKRKTFNKIRKGFFIIIFAGIIFGIFYVYFKTGFLTIDNYEIVGTKDQYVPTLKEKFEEFDKQKLYKILPGNRVISYHNSEMKSFVHNLLPNTESVSIYPVSLHKIRIAIKPYTPIFKVGESLAMTSTAIIYTEMEDINNLPSFSFASSSNITPVLISKITDIIPKVSTSIFEVKFVNVNEYYDIYLQGGIDNKSNVILSNIGDSKKVWSNLLSAIDTEPLKSKLKNGKDKLEYLDTRFGNKVFYKFTNDKQPVIIGTHATTTATSTTSH
jgi:hypothetical protein